MVLPDRSVAYWNLHVMADSATVVVIAIRVGDDVAINRCNYSNMRAAEDNNSTNNGTRISREITTAIAPRPIDTHQGFGIENALLSFPIRDITSLLTRGDGLPLFLFIFFPSFLIWDMTWALDDRVFIDFIIDAGC